MGYLDKQATEGVDGGRKEEARKGLGKEEGNAGQHEQERKRQYRQNAGGRWYARK